MKIHMPCGHPLDLKLDPAGYYIIVTNRCTLCEQYVVMDLDSGMEVVGHEERNLPNLRSENESEISMHRVQDTSRRPANTAEKDDGDSDATRDS